MVAFGTKRVIKIPSKLYDVGKINPSGVKRGVEYVGCARAGAQGRDKESGSRSIADDFEELI